MTDGPRDIICVISLWLLFIYILLFIPLLLFLVQGAVIFVLGACSCPLMAFTASVLVTGCVRRLQTRFLSAAPFASLRSLPSAGLLAANQVQ